MPSATFDIDAGERPSERYRIQFRLMSEEQVSPVVDRKGFD